jgi:hypothetical protein
LSLRQVTVRSRGEFKPSSVASYERGERQISLERLFALARVYAVAPERVVAAIAHRLGEGESGDADAITVIERPSAAATSAQGGGREVVDVRPRTPELEEADRPPGVRRRA